MGWRPGALNVAVLGESFACANFSGTPRFSAWWPTHRIRDCFCFAEHAAPPYPSHPPLLLPSTRYKGCRKSTCFDNSPRYVKFDQKLAPLLEVKNTEATNAKS